MSAGGSANPGAASSSAPQARPLPTLRPMRVEDYPQIQRLEASHDLLTLTPEDWRGVCAESPVLSRLGNRWPMGWVLEDPQGVIVGSMANVLTIYRFEGRELIAATARAWVVAPDYRGFALWPVDEYFNQDGVDLFISTTANSLAVDPFTAFGSERVPLGDWDHAAFFITSYRGFARAALKIKEAPLQKLLVLPAAAALRLRDAVRRKPAAASDVEFSTAFDARFDAFWEELLRENPTKLLNVRDRATLTWHFEGPRRAGHLWVLSVSRGGRLVSYCILKRQDHPPSGLRRMRLVDHQSLHGHEDLLAGMLGVALRRCAAEQIHVLEHVGCELPKTRVFDELAPYRRKLPAWPYYFHAANPQLKAALANPNVWDPSAYDGDSSL